MLRMVGESTILRSGIVDLDLLTYRLHERHVQ